MKVNPPIRLAFCTDKDLMEQLLQVFGNPLYFDICSSTVNGAQLLTFLATTPIFPDVIFISSGIAVQQQQHTLARLFHEYPGLKLIGLLKTDVTLPVLRQMLQYGCNRFMREHDLPGLEQNLRVLPFLWNHKKLFRTALFDQYCAPIIVRINSLYSHLLALLAAHATRNYILQKESFTEAELNEHIRVLMSQLEQLGLLMEAVQQGLISKTKDETTPRNFLYFKNGNVEVKINYDNILLIRSADNYVQVLPPEMAANKNSKMPLYLTTLTAILQTAKASPLARANRTTLVNINYISKMNKTTVWLENMEVELTPSFREAFLEKAGYPEAN